MKSQEPQTRGRRWAGQLPSLALLLVAGALYASVDGFPPSWQFLAGGEVVAVAVFLLAGRRARRWHEDLPNRIRRNDEAARNKARISGPSDEGQGH